MDVERDVTPGDGGGQSQRDLKTEGQGSRAVSELRAPATTRRQTASSDTRRPSVFTRPVMRALRVSIGPGEGVRVARRGASRAPPWLARRRRGGVCPAARAG